MSEKISIALLGSTGSIGKNVAAVVKKNPKLFKLSILTTHKNIAILREQIAEFNPDKVVVTDLQAYQELKQEKVLPNNRVLYGEDALSEVVSMPSVDKVVNALSGFVGFKPSLQAIRQRKQLDIANKESLVVGGTLLIKEAKQHSVRICPIDSEHYALMSLIEERPIASIKRLILTASGGPFLNYAIEDLDTVSPADAVKHPNWRMGAKISIDSATLVNKGFEMISNACVLGFPPDQIDVLIHPQSVVHSLIETIDGHYYAQLGPLDMKLCIQNVLTYPDVLKNDCARIDLTKIAQLTFKNVDETKFPLLTVAYAVAKKGGTMLPVFNASNEKAVEAFLFGNIRFSQIKDIICQCLDAHVSSPIKNENDIIQADAWARQFCHDLIGAQK